MFIIGIMFTTNKLQNEIALFWLSLIFILFLFANNLIKSNIKDKQLNFIDIRYRSTDALKRNFITNKF
jgi:hypothetical protein